jgi:charged multivesicular body protein 4
MGCRGSKATGDAAIPNIDEQIENIEKKEEHLQRKIDAEFANAKKFKAAGKEQEKLQCLKKKKMYEQQMKTLGTSKMNLERLKSTILSLNVTSKINDALTDGKNAVQNQVQKIGGVEKVEELMDGLEDGYADVREIDNAMNRQPGGIDADDDELNAEFDGLMEEELAADLSKVDLGRAVEMTSAPISLPAAGTKKVMTDEEREREAAIELAELEVAMAR